MKYRKVSEYEVTCWACSTMLRIPNKDMGFGSRDDNQIKCPNCGNGVTILRNGRLAESVQAKVYERTWETTEAAKQQ